MANEPRQRRCRAVLWLSLVTSIGCGEARDALRPSADEGDALPTAEIESRPGPAAPTSVVPSTGECAGKRIESAVPLPGYQIHTQAQLDALEGCEIIRGSLSIWFADPDLRPLRALREIEGELVFGARLGGETYPLSLEGLESLERIGWGLTLIDLSLQSLAPLAGLRHLGDGIDRSYAYGYALTIGLCPELESLAPLSGLTTPLESLGLGYNARLGSLAGPPFAEKMRSLDIGSINPDADLSAVGAVREIERIILVSTQLKNLDFLSSLERAGHIELRNTLVEDVGGLTGLEAVGSLSMTHNYVLRSVPAFPRLVAANEIEIEGNPLLEVIEGFPALSSLDGEGGQLTIRYNAELDAVLGLDALQSAGTIHIARNGHLQRLELDALERARVLWLNSNPELPTTSLPFLPQVTADIRKVAGNAGDPTLLDPCPFIDDGICDAAPDDTLCAEGSDASDCGAIYD